MFVRHFLVLLLLLSPTAFALDSDHDTLLDDWEIAHGRNPLIADYQITSRAFVQCALDDNGVKCWGDDNSWGQLNVPTLSNPVQVSAGRQHVCAIDDTGVICWGDNGVGESTPPPLINPVQISASSFIWHSTCALDDNGAHCWGDNSYGQLNAPTLQNPRQISVGGEHVCALDDTGVVCWGGNTEGQLNIPALSNPRYINAGALHTCALDDSGVKCWGSNSHGQLDVVALDGPSYLSASTYNSCAIDNLGIVCWDMGSYIPIAFSHPAAIANGMHWHCGLDDRGVRCWDTNGHPSFVPNLVIDPDHDGISNIYDLFPLDASKSGDRDDDLIDNFSDQDIDGDGLLNASDNCPLNVNPTQTDNDGDGQGDVCDDNDDNDIFYDGYDRCPFFSDNDGADDFCQPLLDGSGDADSDGVLNEFDNCPAVVNQDQIDGDGDGAGDICDVFPEDSDESLDSDGDDVGNNSDVFPYDATEWADSDEDSVGDNSDAFPDDPMNWVDTDADSYGDNDDNCPLIWNDDQLDTDSDDFGDVCDDTPDGHDSDGDGIGAVYDNCPWISNIDQINTDGDSAGDACDAFPVNSAETEDSDGDGFGDNGDAFPYNPSEWLDSDKDGMGNNVDQDDDGDLVFDVSDNCQVDFNPEQVDDDLDLTGNPCDGDGPGKLDALFTSTGANGPVYVVATQSDGKIIIAGSFTTMAGIARNRIARINSDGSLDGSFNPGTGANNSIHAVEIQSDGKILIGGDFTSFNGTTRNRIARLNANGTLDTGFNPGSGTNNTVYAIAVMNDGSILIGGDFTNFAGFVRARLAILNPDGSNAGGTPSPNNRVTDIQIQPDSKVILAGLFPKGINRVNSNLSADGPFNLNTNTGANGAVYTVKLQPDGKIIIGGSFTSFNSGSQKYIVRLNPNGTLDSGFNTGTGFDAAVTSVAIQANGKVIVVGDFTNHGTLSRGKIARLNVDGSPDTNFSPGTGSGAGIKSVAIGKNGKIVVGGNFITYNSAVANYVASINSGDGDRDGIEDSVDMFPDDFDNDGQVNGIDSDDDNDGVFDINDGLPFNASESVDTDGDGTGNNADTDDDNDGVLDINDKFPLDATKSKFVRHDTEIDGDSDVLVRATSTGTWTRHTIQNSVITGTAVMNIPVSSDTVYVTQLDANGDGDADILTRSASTGNWTLHEVQAGAVIASYPISLYSNSGYQFVGTGDFNNDGVDDVMLRDPVAGYRTFLLKNHAVDSTVFYNAWLSADSVDQGIGDFDGDGTDDLLVRRTSDNLYFIFKTVNGAVGNYYCACNIWLNPDWTFQFAGDTNKDGIDDIVIRGTGTTGDGKWWAFRMANFYSQSYTNLNLYANKTRVSLGGWGDYNADGVVDVLTRVDNATTYVSPLNNGVVVSNNWLYGFTADQAVLK